MTHVSGSVLELDEMEVLLEKTAHPPLDAKPDESAVQAGQAATLTPGVTVGLLAGFEETGAALVTFSESAESCPIPARSAIGLSVEQIGHEVALVFEHGDLTKPIILGCL